MTLFLRRLTQFICVSAAITSVFGQASGGKDKTAASATAKTGAVAYADLKAKKVAVPYGTPFTITGELKDVQFADKTLLDLLSVQTVSGDYTTSDGNKGTI